jgi:hypothetical protein
MRGSNPRSNFGMKCVQCGNELIAPERSEYWSDKRLSYLVLPEMQLLFRLSGLVSCETKSMKNMTTRDDIFPSLLVA